MIPQRRQGVSIGLTDGIERAQELQRCLLCVSICTLVPVKRVNCLTDGIERAQELQPCRYSVYSLYWYKSTNTDATDGIERAQELQQCRHSVYSLYWYKSTNTDATDGIERAQELQRCLLCVSICTLVPVKRVN
jgi:hypothetical protein